MKKLIKEEDTSANLKLRKRLCTKHNKAIENFCNYQIKVTTLVNEQIAIGNRKIN